MVLKWQLKKHNFEMREVIIYSIWGATLGILSFYLKNRKKTSTVYMEKNNNLIGYVGHDTYVSRTL